MSPPAPSPLAPILAALLTVVLLSITAFSVHLCLASTSDDIEPPVASDLLGAPEAFASTMAHHWSPRR